MNITSDWKNIIGKHVADVVLYTAKFSTASIVTEITNKKLKKWLKLDEEEKKEEETPETRTNIRQLLDKDD